MANEAQKLMVFELLDTLLRSWWTVVAGVCLGASVSILVIKYTPSVYEAHATISADVDKVPSEFVERTISDDIELQLQPLRNAVLANSNLDKVVLDTFGIPRSEEHAIEIASGIASRVRLEFLRFTRTIAIYYRDVDPERAAKVTNTLAELFVQENKVLRADSARLVRESLETLSGDVDQELQGLKRALNKLAAEHPNEMEDQRSSNMQTIRTLRDELRKNQQAVAAAIRRLDIVKAQQGTSTVTHGREVGEREETVQPDARIIELEQEIATLLRRATENHPDVIAKRQEIARVRAESQSREEEEAKSQASPEGGLADSTPAPPSLDIWDVRVRAAALEVEKLERQGQEIRRQIARYQSYLANTPIVQQQYDDLLSRVQVLQKRYMDNQLKIEKAKAGQQLEEEDIGNPFLITGYAGPPTVPVSPNRLTYLGIGVIGGMVLFVSPLLARTILAPRVTSKSGLQALVDLPLLATIPIIPTPEIRQSKRRAVRRNVGLSVVASSVLAAILALHYLNLV